MQLIANFNDPIATEPHFETRATGSTCARRCITTMPGFPLAFHNRLNRNVNLRRRFGASETAGCAGDPRRPHASGCVSRPGVQDRRWNTRTEISAPKGKGPRARRSIPMARFCAGRSPSGVETSPSSVTCWSRFRSPPRRSGFCAHSFPTRSVPSCAATADGGEY
jgi:hypothetical protein